MGFLDSLLSTGAQVTGIEKSRQALLDAGSAAQAGAAQVGGTAANMAQFQPFTVTGGTGSLTTTPEGGFGMQLNPQQQSLQNNMFGAAQGLSGQIGQSANPMYGQLANQAYGQSQGALGQAGMLDPQLQAQRAQMQQLYGTAAQNFSGMDTAGRQQDIYNQIRAVQTPEEERRRSAMNEQLQAQGRGGIQTAQYGGTPEQFAMAKAQAEAQNQAGLMAMQQTGSEQDRLYNQLMGFQQGDVGLAGAQQALQQGNLGLSSGLFGLGQQSSLMPGQMTQQQLQTQAAMLNAGYAPENQLLNMLAGGTNVASISDMGRRAAANQYAEANMSGLEGMLQSRQGAADLNQRYYEALAGLANSQNSQGQGMVSQIWDGQGGAGSGGGLGGFLSGLLGGGGNEAPAQNWWDPIQAMGGDQSYFNSLINSQLSPESQAYDASMLASQTAPGGFYDSPPSTFADSIISGFAGGSGTYNPFAADNFAGGGGLIDYGSGNPYTFPSGGGT